MNVKTLIYPLTSKLNTLLRNCLVDTHDLNMRSLVEVSKFLVVIDESYVDWEDEQLTEVISMIGKRRSDLVSICKVIDHSIGIGLTERFGLPVMPMPITEYQDVTTD
jgi:hypothetical protein